MPAYIVRKRLGGREGMAGTYGDFQRMVYASSPDAAFAQGKEIFGTDALEVVEYEGDVSHMAVQTKPGHEFDPEDVEIVQPTIASDQ